MPFDEDPSDSRSELDMCIDEICQLQAENEKLDISWKVLSAINCRWYNLARRYAPKEEVKKQESGIGESIDFVTQLQTENKQLKNDNLNLSDDLGWHKAIFDGSWPQAVEILEQTLAKAKALKGE